MKIAILGSTSLIAKSIIPYFLFKEIELRLFCRCMDNFKSFGNEKYDIVINCVGAGGPNKIKSLGEMLIKIDETYDKMVLRYLEKYPRCKYVYLSSGIVSTDKDSTYKIMKVNSEARHRASNRNITDIRIYSFFSKFIKLNAGFLMSEIIRCILSGDTLRYHGRPTVRDYIAPDDLGELILSQKSGNRAIDAFSRAPIRGQDLIDYFVRTYCLKVEYEDPGIENNGVDIYAPRKGDYFSPIYTSFETIIEEAAEILE